MWIYYFLILVSVVMFGGGFALQDLYRKKRGSGLKISMESNCIGSFAGLIVLLIINGFAFEFTPYTFLMALWAALNGMAFTFCTFKALDYINLSLFSLFTMLGGMVLPFLQGIVFYNEGLTVAKTVCIIFICISLLFTVEKGERKNGAIFYAGIFILNGMSGVISKIYTASELPKASAAGYSIWAAAISVVLSGLAWAVLSYREKGTEIQSAEHRAGALKMALVFACCIGALNGALNKSANFLLVLALSNVDASVQYPMVTGGTMIISSLICFLTDKKIGKKEVISIGLAFIGIMLLLFIPI